MSAGVTASWLTKVTVVLRRARHDGRHALAAVRGRVDVTWTGAAPLLHVQAVEVLRRQTRGSEHGGTRLSDGRKWQKLTTGLNRLPENRGIAHLRIGGERPEWLKTTAERRRRVDICTAEDEKHITSDVFLRPGCCFVFSGLTEVCCAWGDLNGSSSSSSIVLPASQLEGIWSCQFEHVKRIIRGSVALLCGSSQGDTLPLFYPWNKKKHISKSLDCGFYRQLCQQLSSIRGR